MKTFVVLALLLSGPLALASGRFTDEIICQQVVNPGEPGRALSLHLQSNSFDWVKNVAILSPGLAAPLTIANITVPLQPEIRDGNGYVREEIMTYKGKGLVLEINVLRITGRPLNGGVAYLSLPGYEPEVVTLDCEYAR